jgi:hypothetical protein
MLDECGGSESERLAFSGRITCKSIRQVPTVVDVPAIKNQGGLFDLSGSATRAVNLCKTGYSGFPTT